MTTSHNTGNAAIATTVTDHAPAIRSSSTISVGNASHGSFGLPPSQSLSAIHRRPPAVELVHCSSSSHSNSNHHRSTLSSVLRQPTSRTKTSHTNVDEGAETEDPHPHLPFNSTNGPPPVSLKRHHSTGADTAATPSSVHLIRATSGMSSMSGNPPKPPPFALTRDLSDLSGSYYNGNSGGGRSTTLAPSNISNTKWRHAKVLSRQRLPQHPQPYNMDDESSYGAAHSAQFRRGKVKSMVSVSNTGSPTTTSISMERGGDIIEVCLPNISFVAAHSNDPTAPSSSRHGSSSNSHKVNRIPLLLILMDPQKQLYELLQLWIDTSIDTVRDILQTINKNIADHHHHQHGSGSGYWKQDYDGLFQIRNNHFSQLIHVLPAGKYDIVPGEVWICKPWSMTSKQTVHHASTLLNHLKQLQILQYRKCSDYGPIWNQWKLFRTTNTSSSNSSHNNNNNKLDDTVLVLSKKATQRLYVPGGILKHHHACQFLSFVPPLENDDDMVVVGPKASTSTTLNNDCSLSTASGLSDSHCDDDDDDDVDLLEEEMDDDHEEILSSDEDKLERTTMNPSRMVPESYQDHMKHHDSSRVVPHSTFTTMTEDEELVLATPSSSSSPLLVPTDDDVWRRNSNATVCSAKTKESTYIFRTYTYHESQDHSNGRTKSIRNTSTNRPILHALPHSHSFGTFHDRTTTSSSSALQRVLRRFYTLFHCRQESMLNRRSRSYDEQLYYTNSSHYNNNNMSNKYAHGKQRKSSATTTRTTLLSDDASMLTTNHPLQYHHDNTMDRNQQQQWRDIDTASHCSGVPLLLTSAPTADWVTHI